MQFSRTKRLSILFLFLAVLTQQQAHAGWADWFNPKSETFQQQVIPKLKDWRTYAVLAGLGVATYFVAPEIYWGCKRALPFYRARNYVRSTFAQYVSDQTHLESMASHAREKLKLNIANPSEETQKRLFKKDVMDATCRPYRLYYEFSNIKDRQFDNQSSRAPQSDVSGIKIHDRSSLVRKQSGVTCGMHSAYNASELYNYFTGQGNYNVDDENKPNPIDRLRQGPNIVEMRQALNNAYLPAHSLDGDWTEQAAIQCLMTKRFEMNEDNFTIIPYTLEFEPRLDEHFIAKVDALCKDNGNCHAFVLGNMRHFGSGAPGSGMQGTSGHWIAVLARKVGDDIFLYAMDSIASHNTQVQVVNKLAQLIRSVRDMSDKVKLDLMISELIGALSTSWHCSKNVVESLRIVEDIVRRVVSLDLLGSDVFQKNACKLIKGVLLNMVKEADLNNEQKETCQKLTVILSSALDNNASSLSLYSEISTISPDDSYVDSDDGTLTYLLNQDSSSSSDDDN